MPGLRGVHQSEFPCSRNCAGRWGHGVGEKEGEGERNGGREGRERKVELQKGHRDWMINEETLSVAREVEVAKGSAGIGVKGGRMPGELLVGHVAVLPTLLLISFPPPPPPPPLLHLLYSTSSPSPPPPPLHPSL